MAKTTVAITVLALHAKAFREVLSDDYRIDAELEVVDEGTKLTKFVFNECGPGTDLENPLLTKRIPYSLRITPSFGVSGKHEHFRIMSDGSFVSTAYTDESKGRMVTLEELIDARQKGISAIDDLIREKDNEYPVISWNDQFEILMLPPL